MSDVPEARLEQTGDGLVPAEPGWFVVNARQACWAHSDELGSYCGFETQEATFEHLGINVNVLRPGEPMGMYHGESGQEDFLILRGECLLIVEGQERPLRQWDFVHCPPWTEHMIVGAGDGPSLVLAVGARRDDDIVYPADATARRHGAGVEVATREPREAYAGFRRPERGPYREGHLPD